MPQGVRQWSIQNFFMSNFIPSYCLVGLLSSNSYNGTFSSSIYNFRPQNLTEIAWVIEGRKYPAIPYKMNFTEGNDQDYVRAFMSLYGETELMENHSHLINYTTHKSGFTLYACSFMFDNPSGEVQD